LKEFDFPLPNNSDDSGGISKSSTINFALSLSTSKDAKSSSFLRF
jgi:hypothetical protein